MYRQKFNVLTPSLSFRIFHEAFLRKDKGIVTSCFLVCASHIQLMIFIFQVFLRLFPTTNAFIGYVDTVTQYFYLFNILYINKTLYSFLRVFAWILSLSYMILYLAMRFIYFKEKKSKTLEKIFTLFNTFYAMVFLLPCLEVLIKDIICDSAVLQQFGHECLQKEHVVIFLFSLISTFACLFMSFLSIFFSQNGMYGKTNCLSGENRGYDFLISSIKVLLVSTSIILEDSPGFKHAYFSLNLVYSIILFCSFLIYFPYNKRIIEMLCISWLAIYLAHSLGTLISSVSEDPDFMASFPFVGFAVLIITFAILAYQQSKFRLIIKEQVSSTRELVRKVQQIFQLKHSHELNSNGEICFRGIISRHLDTCIESDCFCKQMELYDPKKERTLDLEKWTTSKSVVLKYYARLLFEQQLKKTPLDTDLLISYANFLFQKFHNTHLSLYQLMIVTNHKVYLYPRQRQKIFKLRHQISEYIDAKNADALEVAMEIENVLRVEDQFTKVLETMKEIIQKSLNFWKYLAEKELNMKKIHRLAKELSNTVDATIQLWSPLKPYLQKYKKLMYYYNWFLKEFLIKKTIVSEEQVDDLFDDDMYSVHSNDFIHILKNDHILFNDDTPVIHISGNPMDLGRIIKLNRATMKVFGYTKEELLKSNVSKLMPKIIGDKHTSYLEAHTKTGKAKVLYEQRKVFGRNREGYVFPMWLIVKQFNNLQGLVEYVGLIRPMSEKKEDPHEYILLNEYGEVGGITKNLVPLLGIKEEKLHKKSFNIAMLAPKLIQFLTLRQFLQEFDPEREKQKIKEENNRNKMQIIGDDIVSPRKVNSPDTPETGGFSSAYKFAQSVDDQKNFTPDPDTLISVWKEPKENTSHISPLGTGTRNIDIREFLELDLYDEVKEVECPEPEKDILMEKQVEKEVEFTLRIPRNFDEYVKEFEAIKARQRLSLHVQQQFVDIVQMNLMSNRSQIDTTRNLNILSHRSQIESTRNLLDKGNVGKKMVQQHFINSDAYLNALKTTATKIAKSHTSRIYRISGTVGIDTYGPEGDKLKYIKITEVKLYEEKKAGFSSSSVSLSTFNYLPKKEGKSSEFSVDGPVTPAEMGESRSHRDSRARPYKLSIFSGLKSKLLLEYIF